MKAIFVPSMGEAKHIFPDVTFSEWQMGIMKGEFKGCPLFITGVSKTPTAMNSAIIFQNHEITEAILTGVCGAYRGAGFNVGDMVSIDREYFADEGLSTDEGFQTIFEMGFGFIKNSSISLSPLKGLPKAVSNTVSFLDGKGDISEVFHNMTGAQVENMEGASFAYVCNAFGVKAFQVRAVSNFCGIRSKQEWDFKQAVHKLKTFYELYIF